MSNRGYVGFLWALVLIMFATSMLARDAPAQEWQHQFTPGEMVETGGGLKAKILGCRGQGVNEECQVQYYRGDTLESTPRWESASVLRSAEERALNVKRREAAEHAGPADAGQQAPTAPSKSAGTQTAAATAECTFEPPGDASKTAEPSAQLFKRKIYDLYNVAADGTASAPSRVGVTFLAFQVGTPFTNTVRVAPGRGAAPVNDTAPVNATIYPVKSKHVVCEEYKDRTLRRLVENKYECFKDRFGEWVCGIDGVPKITQLPSSKR